MSNIQSYNALIDRFKAFASGHFILKTFSHGQIDTADLEKFTEYPFMHVVPSNVTYAKGTKTFSFQIVLADLPRDKDDKVEFQREVLSDLQRIAEDLVAEITNHRVLFGDLITVQNVSLEPFLEEFHNTLTGWTVSLELLVPYYWDACSIPAEWNDFFESSTGGTGSILTFIDSIVRDNNGNVSLVNDEANPLPNYYYGTNGAGVRGWYLTTDNIGLTCETIGSCETIIDIEAAIDLLQQDVIDINADIALKADITSISAVGFSNDYDDLDNKPTIPTTLPPNGAAGGDLTGTYPNPTVHRVHGVDFQSGAPAVDDTWIYVSTPLGPQPFQWQHSKLKTSQVQNDSTVTGATAKLALEHLDSSKVPTTRTLTINGTTQDLSADRTFTISSSNIYNADGSLTAARTLTLNSFALTILGTTSSRFFANGNVGIGTTTDSGFKLDVVGNDGRINTLTIGLGGGQVSTNTALGFNALGDNTTGYDNTAIGTQALGDNTIGEANTAVGYYPLQKNTTGNNNSAFGYASLLNNLTSSNHTAMGTSSLRNITSGSYNTAFGVNAGRYIADGTTSLTTSSTSIFIGSLTKPLADSQTNQIVIGYNAIGLGSNSVVLGNSSITLTALRGNVLIGTTTDAGFKLDVNGSVRATGSISAASLLARGTYLNQTLVATANNDVLVGLDIQSTFTNGAFTGVTNYLLRAGAGIGLRNDGVVFWGNSLSGNNRGILNWDTNRAIISSGTTSTALDLAVNLTTGLKLFTSRSVMIQNGGTFTEEASSQLSVNSTTRGFLPPRMTTTQKNAIATPATGLMVYDTTLNLISVYNGTIWISL